MRFLTVLSITLLLLGAARAQQSAVVTETVAPTVRTYDSAGHKQGELPAQDLVGRPVQAVAGALPLLQVTTASGPVLVQTTAVRTNRPVAPPSAECVTMTTQKGLTTAPSTNGLGKGCSDAARGR